MSEWQVFCVIVVVLALLVIQVSVCVGVFKHGVEERDGNHVAVCVIQGLFLLVVLFALLTWYIKI